MNKIEFYSNLAKFQGRNGDAFLKHYGIIGQKWGTRRWQNADGTFNEEGKQRYFGKSSNNSSEDDKVGGLFSKKKKNEDANTNKNTKKETTVDYLNKLLEEEAKRKEKYKYVYNYIQEKNENGKYEDEYGEYDDPDFDAENEKIGSINNKTDKLLNSEEYKDLARNVGVDFLDPNDLASDDIKKDYKAVKHNMNPFIVAIDDIAHDNEQSAIDYLNRFVKDKKEREILTKLCKKYGEQEKITIKENNENTKKLIKSIEHNKNLKGNNISNEEYEKILNDTKSNNDLKKENAKNVADIGLYKLNQMGNGGGDPGDNSSRAWFMYEDQTIGLPELTYLYYQGYSKNYIKQYVKNVSNKLNNMSYDEQDEYYENHPGVWGISYANDYDYADDWIDTLFKN